MRHGLCLPQIGPAAVEGRVAEFARTAEALGYGSLWVSDRLLAPVEPQDPYPGGSTPERPYPPEMRVSADPLVTLAAAAGATDQVRLGSSTLNAPWYGAVALARALTSLDVVSGGRLDAGFGLGWMRDEYEAAGMPWERRGRLLEETIEVLRAWWAHNPVEHRGEHVQLPLSWVDLRPVQAGGPPILLGGYAPVALRRVGRLADGWLTIDSLAPDDARAMWETVREAAADAGRDPGELRRELRIDVDRDSDDPARLAEICAAAEADGVDGVHVDFKSVAAGVDAMLDLAEALAEKLTLT